MLHYFGLYALEPNQILPDIRLIYQFLIFLLKVKVHRKSQNPSDGKFFSACLFILCLVFQSKLLDLFSS